MGASRLRRGVVCIESMSSFVWELVKNKHNISASANTAFATA
jgi:hypothetical protein